MEEACGADAAYEETGKQSGLEQSDEADFSEEGQRSSL